jgi:hypothetical protein
VLLFSNVCKTFLSAQATHPSRIKLACTFAFLCAESCAFAVLCVVSCTFAVLCAESCAFAVLCAESCTFAVLCAESEIQKTQTHILTHTFTCASPRMLCESVMDGRVSRGRSLTHTHTHTHTCTHAHTNVCLISHIHIIAHTCTHEHTYNTHTCAHSHSNTCAHSQGGRAWPALRLHGMDGRDPRRK